ncbi:hypothetical protein Cs7R123_20840 [Catellatospora sp. TT07R-123]|uniref:M91 family zinc metallopeptidase n=1 Tax=Catellatospora sp. TT07R-123 TaxID=2733863 RepID=UPI001B07310A|nr:M91 family zinc metallopeptidase [Catellatospora sp. TT07R-123]GHJ44742.1 hypothetical protein Cs7R123_20840 [Catellatospora sp. TT07R-123]
MTAAPTLVEVPALWTLDTRPGPLLAAAAGWRACADAADRAATGLTGHDPARSSTRTSGPGPDRAGHRGAMPGDGAEPTRSPEPGAVPGGGSTRSTEPGVVPGGVGPTRSAEPGAPHPAEDWTGRDATAFAQRSAHLADRLTVVGRIARRAAAALDELAARTASTERHLDESLARVRAAVPHRAGPEQVVFAVAGPAPRRLVGAAVAEAGALRADLAAATRTAVAALDAAAAALRWLAEPPTTATGPELVEAQVLHAPGLTVVRTGKADDTLAVTVEDGRVMVRADGRAVAVLDPADGRIVLRTGAGDDRTHVDPGVPVPVTVLAGAGADLVDGGDVLVGGDGRDTLLAGARDAVLLGGGSRDYLQGDTGDDLLDGGDGDDTAYGLDGDDTLRGGTGHDHLDGGRGDDDLRGEADPDTLAPGAGADTAAGGTAADLAYLDAADTTAGPAVEQVHHRVDQAPDEPGGRIRVEGSARFQARVESDLDLLRASPLGQGMLAELDRGLAAWEPSGVLGGQGAWPWLAPPADPAAGVLTIRELPPGTDNAYAAVEDGRHTVGYDTSFDGLGGTVAGGDATPVAVLYHEFAHVWDHLHGYAYPHGHHADDVMWDGTRMVPVPAAERVAVGLPVDDDGDPTTPDRLDPRHPYPLTENALRAELGERSRVSYGDTAAASVTSP